MDQMQRLLAITGLVLSFGLSAQASTLGDKPATSKDSVSRIAIMTFNAENLFDTVDDKDREDETYLPVAVKRKSPEIQKKCQAMTNEFYRNDCLNLDWSEQVFETKISRVAEVVRNVNGGRGPDILTLAEIENINALNLLNQRKLKDLGYQTAVLIEGPDMRGIDNAVLSRFPQWDKAQNHIVPYVDENGKPDRRGAGSRGILEVRLLLPDGQKLAVFAAHFPSQSNPTYLRLQAVRELNRLKSQLPKDVIAIAGGDFNITREEDSISGYISKDLAANWMVSHIVGCNTCKGTEVYKRTWSFLDLLAFSPSLDASKVVSSSPAWYLDTASIMVPKPVKDHVNQYGEPNRFSPPSTGISDHWPVYAELYKR